jgi:hypothetical protein
MTRLTIQQVARESTPVGLEVLAVIDAGGGAGFVLTERPDTVGVLGVGAVDLIGDHAAIGLDDDEARQLRDALTAWLER